VSAAMLITNFFFTKRSFMSYDRFLIGIAALFLASKIYNENKWIDQFSKNFLRARSIHLKESETIKEPTEQEVKDTSEWICKYEALILKSMMDHTGMIFGHDLPYWVLRKYVDALIDVEDGEWVYNAALHFLNDSFFTRSPLIHSSNELALACVILAA